MANALGRDAKMGAVRSGNKSWTGPWRRPWLLPHITGGRRFQRFSSLPAARLLETSLQDPSLKTGRRRGLDPRSSGPDARDICVIMGRCRQRRSTSASAPFMTVSGRSCRNRTVCAGRHYFDPWALIAGGCRRPRPAILCARPEIIHGLRNLKLAERVRFCGNDKVWFEPTGPDYRDLNPDFRRWLPFPARYSLGRIGEPVSCGGGGLLTRTLAQRRNMRAGGWGCSSPKRFCWKRFLAPELRCQWARNPHRAPENARRGLWVQSGPGRRRKIRPPRPTGGTNARAATGGKYTVFRLVNLYANREECPILLCMSNLAHCFH